MCGIVGTIALTPEYSRLPQEKKLIDSTWKAVRTLSERGPDFSEVKNFDNAVLGHSRLAIIDKTSAANQPFTDPSGRYCIVFNGEIYNFKELRSSLQNKEVVLSTESDTEVLLLAYLQYGKAVLNQLNGFFAFAIHDNFANHTLIARDRFGIKPLVYYQNESQLMFASELKALMAYNFKREIDEESLQKYLQLNYIPAPHTILKYCFKLKPGHCIEINNFEVSIRQYYKLGSNNSSNSIDYVKASLQVKSLLHRSVSRRMVSDVSLGAFLSGGIDSSIIAALASKETTNLNTFSIGFKDEPFFDETKYANLVAKKIGSEHTVFSITNQMLFDHFEEMSAYLDEPFADSSAINVYLLSKFTKEHVTVSLSGDGADELFAGYNKHSATLRSIHPYSLSNLLLKHSLPIWKNLPQTRNSRIGNLFRQVNRYAEGLQLTPSERYWEWTSILKEDQAKQLLCSPTQVLPEWTESIVQIPNSDFNWQLLSDFALVLPDDMLKKVDSMSMANSLEVRTPFLDHELVEYVFSLPSEFKIDRKSRKKILKEAFKSELPPEIFTRRKQGFEVPLLKWFNTSLKKEITENLLHEDYLQEQRIFNPTSVQNLVNKLYSKNPGDSPATIWALIIFQKWYRNYFTV